MRTAMCTCACFGCMSARRVLTPPTLTPARYEKYMSMARDVTAVLQHHDSITGTSKQQVTADLDVRLRASIAASTAMLAGAIGPAGSIGSAGGPVCPFPAGSTPNATCHTVNVGQSVLLFNAMAQPRTEFIELSISHAAVASAPSFGVFFTPGTASQSKAVAVDAVVVPAVPGAFAGAQVEHNASSATLIFRAELPALSFGSFQLLPVANTSGGDSVAVQQASWDCAPPTSDVSIGFGSFAATFDVTTRRLKELRSGTASFSVDQAFAEYHATSKSNAYQFAPNCTSGYPSGEPLARGKAPALCTLSSNKVLRRAVQTYASPAVLRETSTVWATASSGAPDTAVLQTTTEFVMNTAERELVTRYASDLDNTVQGHYFNSSETTDHLPVFETDDNGALMLRRVVNKTYWGKDEAVFHVTMPTAGNYYPLSVRCSCSSDLFFSATHCRNLTPSPACPPRARQAPFALVHNRSRDRPLMTHAHWRWWWTQRTVPRRFDTAS